MDIFILLLLILLNGVFAMSELALVSSRKVRLQQWADDGNKGAQAALKLADEPTRFLSTIQIGITSIGIMSGVFGEEAIAQRLAAWLNQYPLVAPYSTPLSVGVMVLTITTMSLIFGELVPKRLAMHNPEVLATLVSRPMTLLARATAPLVRVLSLSTDAVLRLMGSNQSKEPSITEEEIRVLMEQGADEGVFDRAEQELVENIFRLDDRKVASIMTPRKDIVSLDIEDDHASNCQLLQSHPYSRYPVCKGGMDQLIGIVDSKHLLDRLLSGGAVDFTAGMHPPLYVPATVSLMQLLEQFKRARIHMALVVDEYGELEGMVTLHDVLESIVGGLPAGPQEDEQLIIQRDEHSWLVDGMVGPDELREHFAIDSLLPGEDTGNIHTLGGVVMFQLGRVPVPADRFEWNGFAFEVVDMDKTRVDKVMVSRLETPPPANEEMPAP